MGMQGSTVERSEASKGGLYPNNQLSDYTASPRHPSETYPWPSWWLRHDAKDVLTLDWTKVDRHSE